MRIGVNRRMNRRNLQIVGFLSCLFFVCVSAQAKDFTGISKLSASQRHLVRLCKKSYLHLDNRAEKELEALTQAGLQKHLAPCLKRLKPEYSDYACVSFELAYNGIDVREKFDRMRNCSDEDRESIAASDSVPYSTVQIYLRYRKDYLFNAIMDTTEDGHLAEEWDDARASLFTVYPDLMLRAAEINPKRLDILARSVAGEGFFPYRKAMKRTKPYLQMKAKDNKTELARAAQVCLNGIAQQEKFLADMDAAQKREREANSKGVK